MVHARSGLASIAPEGAPAGGSAASSAGSVGANPARAGTRQSVREALPPVVPARATCLYCGRSDEHTNMRECGGTGIAAPQLGMLYRLAVVERDRNRLVLINPTLHEVDHLDGVLIDDRGTRVEDAA